MVNGKCLLHILWVLHRSMTLRRIERRGDEGRYTSKTELARNESRYRHLVRRI